MIISTTDGGFTWTNQVSGTTKSLFNVFFSDANTGTAVGADGTVLHTTDGGRSNWVSQSSGTLSYLSGVSFIDANIGVVVGSEGTILHTTDGGTTWVSQSSGTTAYLLGMSFIDANIEIAVGSGGTILRTTDGGASWRSQSSGTANSLYGVQFTDYNTGWVVGTYGTILHTTNGGVTFAREENVNVILKEFSLAQNYPNPFNPTTKIKYEIPDQVRNDNIKVQLKVYDVLGKEVVTIVNEYKPAGKYETEFNADNLASGVYFYRLQAGLFIQTKKMLLLK